VDVHLDSLPIQPSFRPQQMLILFPFLNTTGFGLISGDFNPVTPEDSRTVESNGLSAWLSLHPDEPGQSAKTTATRWLGEVWFVAA
jgi:tyrosyl-DNA phosphodiesterase 2